MKISNMTLIDYNTLVQSMANGQKNDLIDNDTVNHAHILVSELVKTANDTIRLYTNSFCEEFYSSEKVKKAFKEVSKNNVKLLIISENNIIENKSYLEYKKMFNKKLELKENNNNIEANFGSKREILNNFMLIDDRGIRYEQEKKENICDNIKDIKARGTFNRPNDIAPFVEAFNSSFAQD